MTDKQAIEILQAMDDIRGNFAFEEDGKEALKHAIKALKERLNGKFSQET